MEQKPPDVIVLGPEWPERALLRAQLIEEGHEVIAVDTWPIPRLYRRPEMKPRVLLIDLHELPTPRETLDEVRFVLPSESGPRRDRTWKADRQGCPGARIQRH